MLQADVAYGGNFYAIIGPQENIKDLNNIVIGEIQRLSPIVCDLMNENYEFQHPETPEIMGLSHVMWTGRPLDPLSTARNVVFYGYKAIERSSYRKGTSARMV